MNKNPPTYTNLQIGDDDRIKWLNHNESGEAIIFVFVSFKFDAFPDLICISSNII